MTPNKPVPDDIDGYIARYPKDTRAILEKIRATIQRAAPEAEEAISYCMPCFRLNGALVYFAAFNDHISFFPTSTATKKFKKELARYDTAKGTVRFPYGRPVPYGLIGRIARFRAQENSARVKKK
jgi:uncharacterized protein YdhG (YjbR/CyaY superfamily)